MSNPESPGKNLSPNLRQGNGSDCTLKQSGFREGLGGGQLWRLNSKCSNPEKNSGRLEPAKVLLPCSEMEMKRGEGGHVSSAHRSSLGET